MRKFLMVLIALCFSCIMLFAQKTITGKVTDDKGNPIPNASVIVQGSRVGTTTKSDGTFTINAPANAKSLIISSIGSEEKVIAISSGNFNVQLETATQDLSEVVVQVPYGTVKKAQFTGSEGTISAKTLEKQQQTSVTKMLEGLVPGIIATNGGGTPGSSASVLIRGVGSVSSSSSPLYVLNGVPYDGSIAALSTDEIETVTVLKDAAAAALYGSRAANGVIMITTKTGKKGSNRTSVSIRNGWMSRGIPEYDRVSIPDYYELYWEAIKNGQQYGPAQSSAAVAGAYASANVAGINGLVYNAYNVAAGQLIDPTTGKISGSAQLLYNDSWEDALYRSAGRQNINVNFSGGNDKTTHFISMGYLNEDGIVKFSGYKRYNGRVDIKTSATKWLNAGLNIDGSLAENNNVPSGGTATTNPFYYTRQMGPIYPVWQRDASGNKIVDPATGDYALDWGVATQMGARPYAPNSNLLGSLALDDRGSKVFNGNANAFMEVLFLKDFSFKTTLGATYWNSFGTTYQNSQFGDAQNVSGRSTKSGSRQFSKTFNQVLSYNKTFLTNHNIRALVGHESYDLITSSVSATKVTFPFPGTSELDNAATIEGAGSSTDVRKIEGYFSNINYDYKGKYMASASFRRDGTSRFFVDNRWGNFYSFGVGWKISAENFMENVNWVDDLKFRASYGEQGNEAISAWYAWQPLYGLGWNNALTPGGLAGSPANPELVWEGNKTTNIGIDFTIFKRRLQGTIEVFNRVSNNLLFDEPLPGSTGNLSITRNIGVMFNRGIEISLGYNVIQSRLIDWRVDVNFTKFKNEITKMPELTPTVVSGTKQLKVGQGIYDFWLREFAGVDAATGEALYYKDVLDTDGKTVLSRELTPIFTQATFAYHGSALPDFSGGVTNSLRVGSFDLSFLLVYSYGGKFLDGNYQSLMHRGNSFGTHWHTDILNRWQKPGDITNVPRIDQVLATNEGTSTRYLFDGSFLNVKNITLSYNLPKTALSSLKGAISSLQIFANVDNAHLFTTHKGMDPQRAFTGTSDWSYTPFRTFTLGLNLGL